MVFCLRCFDYECNIVKSMHYCVCMQHFSYTTTPCKNIALTLQLCHNVVLCDNAMQLCCVKTLQQYELLRNSRRVWLSLTACVFSCMWSHLCWSLRLVRLCLCVLSRIAVSFQRSIESHWSILGFRPHCSQLHCVNSALYWWLKHNSIFPNRIVLFHDSHPDIPQRVPSNSCTKNLFIIFRNTLGLVLSQLWI